MSARLLSIELEAFRGFAASQRLDLDGDVVLVRGDNGTGKTSVTDGLLWLFTGKIPRLTERAKGLRKTEDPVISRYRPTGPARVRLEIGLPHGRRLTFQREGRADHSALTAWNGDEHLDDAAHLLARAFGLDNTSQVNEAVGSWGILQQHAVLAALDSGQALHERLAEVVGLEHVTRFATAASDATRKLKAELKRMEDSTGSMRQRRIATGERLSHARSLAAEAAERRPRLSTLVQDSMSELPVGIAARDMPAELEDVAALGRQVGSVVEAARDVVASVERLDRAEADVSEAVDAIEAELGALMERADAAVRRAPIQVRLAGAALELVGDTCPVCGQSIDEASVRTHLTEMLTTAQAEADAADSAQRAVAEAQARLIAARSAEARRRAAREELDGALVELRARLADGSWLSVDREWVAAERSPELVSKLSHWQEQLRMAYAEGRRDAPGEVVRLASDASAIDHELERAQDELERLRDRVRRASALDKAAHIAAQRIVDRALQRLAPSFAEVYDRLAPHPTFTELRATQDIYYGKNQVVPEVWDPVRAVRGNPALVLSEGQLNVVALSYFLGLALNAGPAALPFLVLDDPLQAMDVLSVLGFADLCRRIREHRQLIVTTHDRRFASLLGRKLAPREPGTRTIVHEFEAWTEEGPRIRFTDQPVAEVVPLLGRRAS